MKISVTRKFEFSYAHHLPGYKGDCARAHGHNSNVEVEIALKGKTPPANGMIIDFKELDAIVKDKVLDKLDHRDISPLFEHPTAENIVLYIFSEVQIALRGRKDLEVIRVRASETNDSFAEVKK
jgi:6-pyruvoyltetrahydropterin/6-carboxytetrahydropterin synthase